ncbi:receptor-like protein kinase FERONIA [Vicia villosa]|uniref:receptor-like protein kinase FERONIA n=1 Tax=Vicia villosa TaxID=3911 RepID=UPI00273C0E41|nr:receptor-like protein kinase FERONIA [Vicia villosa]
MLHKHMNVVTCFIIYYTFTLNPKLLVAADNISYVPSENIVLNCGSNTSQLVQYDGRFWIGDIHSPYLPYNDFINHSLTSTAPSSNLQSIPQVPYMTARIFLSQFTYTFNVTSGPKFIRLHFYPFSYLNFNISKAFLSVTADNFTLVHNFSVSLNADYFNLAYFMKEFIVHVKGNSLELTFAPSSNASDSYAFVNGIEIVSMPNGLYINGDDSPLPLVGHYPTVVYIYNETAMENLYRLNVGGEQILPIYDTGMFRNWDIDDGYIFGADNSIKPYDEDMKVLYKDHVPSYTAPSDVYRTSRSMAPFEKGLVNLNYNQTWFFSVDSGFRYLIRLHFCEINYSITRVNEVVFSMFLNNQTAEEEFDPVGLSGGPGIPIYKDYVVMVPEDSDAKQDLWLDLHPDKYSKPLYYSAYLNGVEIFKLSYVDTRNLAGLNPSEKKFGSSTKATPHDVENSKKHTFIFIGCGLMAVVIPILLCLFLLKFKVIKPSRFMSCFALEPNQIEKEKNPASFCCQFSLEEIKVATNDFNEALLIGTGGFGSVYKGSFDGSASFVAIKRADLTSQQGVTEFETEIHLLSSVSHNNIVSLLGYCNEDDEKILVYDFMPNGTLYDHLHLNQRDQHQPHLSWIQRLEICIGVAKGLHYLHTGTKQKIIHRDIKTTNILLDHNWVAKISDFGLSKESYTTLSTTVVKGSTGYVDPEYYQRGMLTEKSDLYSLGVVLLEVLSSRQALSPCEEEEEDDEHLNLGEWAKFCYENGNVEEIVDQNLEGKIVKECLELYLGVAMKCLGERGAERPSSGDVLQNLLMAIQFQKNGGNVQNVMQEYSDLTPGIEFSDIMMPVGR